MNWIISLGQLSRSPILWQEVRRLLRSQKSFWFLLAFLSFLLYQVIGIWSVFTQQWTPNGNISAGSREFFYKLSQAHLVFLTIFTPLLMTPSIVSERERSTFDLLISSPITLFHIVVAKLLSPLIFVMLLMFSAIPVLALSFIGGGLSIPEVMQTYLILFVATINLGLLGLLCSTLRKRIHEVYLIAAAAVFFYTILLPFHGSVWRYITTVNYKGMYLYNHGFQFMSPFFALREVVYPTNIYQTHSGGYPGNLVFFSSFFETITTGSLEISFVLSIHLWLQVLIGMILMGIILKRVRTIAYASRSETKHSESEEDILENTYERDYELSFDSVSEEGNPGLMLEQKVQWFTRYSVMVRIFYCALMISILTLPLVSYEGSWLFLTLPFVVAAFFTLPLAATSISGDRERGTLDLLRTTLISTEQIVHAKYVTNLMYSFFIALALYLPGMLILIICGVAFNYNLDLVYKPSDTLVFLWYVVILFTSMVLYTAICLFCSAYFRQTNRALIFSGILILFCLLGPSPIPQLNVASITFGMGGGSVGLSVLSPLALMGLLFPEGRVKLLGKSLGLTWVSGNWIYALVIVQCALSLLVAVVLYKMTVRVVQQHD